MSGQMSLALRRALLETLLLRTLPEWNQVSIALTRQAPAANASEAQLDEPTTGAYARRTITLSSANWELGETNDFVNVNQILFPTATASWGTIHGWAIISAKSSAWGAGSPQVLATGVLTTPLRVSTGIRPALAPGTISWGLGVR